MLIGTLFTAPASAGALTSLGCATSLTERGARRSFDRARVLALELALQAALYLCQACRRASAAPVLGLKPPPCVTTAVPGRSKARALDWQEWAAPGFAPAVRFFAVHFFCLSKRMRKHMSCAHPSLELCAPKSRRKSRIKESHQVAQESECAGSKRTIPTSLHLP